MKQNTHVYQYIRVYTYIICWLFASRDFFFFSLLFQVYCLFSPFVFHYILLFSVSVVLSPFHLPYILSLDLERCITNGTKAVIKRTKRNTYQGVSRIWRILEERKARTHIITTHVHIYIYISSSVKPSKSRYITADTLSFASCLGVPSNCLRPGSFKRERESRRGCWWWAFNATVTCAATPSQTVLSSYTDRKTNGAKECKKKERTKLRSLLRLYKGVFFPYILCLLFNIACIHYVYTLYVVWLIYWLWRKGQVCLFRT